MIAPPCDRGRRASDVAALRHRARNHDRTHRVFLGVFSVSRVLAVEARALHSFPAMSRRTHFWMRIGALALLATAALVPMPKAPKTRTHAARAETTSARFASSPRTTKVVVASAESSRASN